MHSAFRVTDLSAYSPFDVGEVQVVANKTAVPAPAATHRPSSKAKGAKAVQTPTSEKDSFTYYTQPCLLGRRVDTNTRRVSPIIERLPVEPHSFTLTFAPFSDNSPDDQNGVETTSEESTETANPKRRKLSVDERRLASTSMARPNQPQTGEKKQLKVLRPQVPAASPSPSPSTPTLTPAASPQPTPAKATPETVVVKLKDGRFARIPIEMLQRVQMRSPALPSGPAVPAPRGAADSFLKPDTLSSVLQRISPVVTSSSSATSSPPVNGHAQQTNNVVRIRAYQSPTASSPAATPPAASADASRLSDTLKSIIPLAVTTTTTSSPMTTPQIVHRAQAAQIVLPGNSVLSSPPAKAGAASASAVSGAPGLRLSTALSSVVAQALKQQNGTPGSTTSSSTRNVIIISPSPGQTMQGSATAVSMASAAGQQVLSQGQILQRVQLAPIFSRKGVVSTMATGGGQQQQQLMLRTQTQGGQQIPVFLVSNQQQSVSGAQIRTAAAALSGSTANAAQSDIQVVGVMPHNAGKAAAAGAAKELSPAATKPATKTQKKTDFKKP